MMKSKTILIFVLSLIFLMPANALACACCAEPGTYMIWSGKPWDFDLEILEGMEFGKKATLFLTEADFEIVKGLDAIKEDLEKDYTGEMDLIAGFKAKTWRFTVATKSGKTGVLELPMPLQMLKFKVDIHDGKNGGGGGPLLYKEFRFKGKVRSGSGFFRSGLTSPATYFLVFQGRGNGCDNIEDFSNWRLEIEGRKADYAFFGTLSSGAPADDQAPSESD